MKKSSLFIASVLALSLAACGVNTNGKQKHNPNWPSDDINAWVEEMGYTNITIPEIPEGRFNFDYSESGNPCVYASDNGEVGVNSYEDQYVTILEKAKWEIDDSEYEDYGYFAYESSEQVVLQFFTYEGEFDLYFYDYEMFMSSGGGDEEYTQFDEWPAQELATFLQTIEADSNASIPTCNQGSWYGAEGFDLFGNYCFDLYSPDDGTIMESYLNTLEAAGWSIDYSYALFGVTDCIDPTGTVDCLVCDYLEEYGEVGLSFSRNYAIEYGEWPADQIASLLESIDAGDVTFPSLEGEFSCMLSDDDGDPYLSISALDEGTIGTDSYEDVLTGLLEAANWTIDDTYYEEYGYFANDPTNKVEVQYYTYEGEFELYIYAASTGEGGSDAEFAPWPADVIASYLSEAGIEGVTVPSLDGEFLYSIEDNCVYLLAEDDDNKIGTNSLEDIYKATLEAANWTIDDSEYDSYGYLAQDESEQVTLQFYTYDDLFELYIFATPSMGSDTEGEDGTHVATLDFTTMSNEEVFTSQKVGSITVSGIQTSNKGNSPTFYANGNTLRFYWGNAITFTPDSNATITKIEITYNTNDEKLNEDVTASNGALNKDSTNGKITITPTDGKKMVTMEVGGSKGRIGLTSVSITYTVE